GVGERMGRAGWPMSARRARGSLRRLDLGGAGCLAEFEELLGCARREDVHDAGDAAGPPRLVAGADACAVVAVEVLVEQDQVTPVRVVLELARAAVYRAPAVLVAEKDAGHPLGKRLGHLVEIHPLTGTGRVVDSEVV